MLNLFESNLNLHETFLHNFYTTGNSQNQTNFSVFAIFLSVAFSQQFFAQLYPVAGTCTSLGTNTYALNSTANSSATNR